MTERTKPKSLGKAKLEILHTISAAEENQILLTQLSRKMKKAPSTVLQHLREMEANTPKLVIQHTTRGWWQLTDAGRGAIQALLSVEQPEVERQRGIEFWGSIAAGPATPLSDASDEDLPISDLDPDNHFAMRVTGNSMVDFHICNGDMVILRRVGTWMAVSPGDIVALRVPEGTREASEETLEQTLNTSDDASEPVLDHGILKKMTGDNLLSLCQSIEDGRIELAVTGSRGNIVKSPAFQVMGILVRVQRDYRHS